ncbi:MarR family transcriptional regulator [Pseudomonas sp. Z1-14]|uniref:MarR family winged helix-turn-helix transcriptional regulator n=1 Tax=Pseudomonas sp. Z1-14 TaxID=2817409 RepID=UPI003DA8FAA1
MNVARTDQRLCFEGFLPCRIKAISERVLRLLSGINEEFGISSPEFSVMVVAMEVSNLSAKHISQVTGLDKAAITRALDRLSTKSLIQRERCGADNRRLKISLTRLGLEKFRRIEAAALEWEKGLLKGISVAELNKMYLIFDKIDCNLAYLER